MVPPTETWGNNLQIQETNNALIGGNDVSIQGPSEEIDLVLEKENDFLKKKGNLDKSSRPSRR